MVDIVIKNTKDSILVKDCDDFIPLEDGTIIGDKRYCNLSFQCKQIGMMSEYVQKRNGITGELLEHDYLCTGKYAIFEERSRDERAE